MGITDKNMETTIGFREFLHECHWEAPCAAAWRHGSQCVVT